MKKSRSAVHRRFPAWCRNEVLRRVLTDVANDWYRIVLARRQESHNEDTDVLLMGCGLATVCQRIVRCYSTQLAFYDNSRNPTFTF